MRGQRQHRTAARKENVRLELTSKSPAAHGSAKYIERKTGHVGFFMITCQTGRRKRCGRSAERGGRRCLAALGPRPRPGRDTR